ncbi:MAG: glycosyltransferase, partial [Bryobacteraceae bacterium]
MQTRPAGASPGSWSGSIGSLFHKLIASQDRLTRKFDRLLPSQHLIGGNADFIDTLVPQYTPAGAVVYDVGGGRNPLIDAERKAQLGLRIVGLDIDAGELAAAPPGRYDHTICADILSYRGAGDADLVICQALLEHVLDTGQALEAIASILKPGGQALLFVPSRNAVYARINLLLPQKLKERILFGIYPHRRRSRSFPAHYDRCTPAALEALALRKGLRAVERRVYFQSNYFRFCLPIHALWRLWVLLFRSLAGNQAAETFSLVLRKEEGAAGLTHLENRVVVFGMNSSFAVWHCLPEVLHAVQNRGFDAVVAAPQPAEPTAFQTSFPGVDFRHVPMKREISLLSDIGSLCRLWFLLRSVRPALTDMSTPKMGLIGGLAAWLARVPHRIYTLRGLRYETARSWKRKLLIACEKIACACAHQVICISRSVRQTAIQEGLAPAGKLVLLGERVSEGITIEPEPEIRGGELVHLRKQLRIPGEAAVIGYVGRLTRDKGVRELVQCFQILQRGGRAVHLLLLGDFESG